MPIAPVADLVAAAAADGCAVVAFNVITLEHAEAVVMGAQRAGRPVIAAISENAVRYHGDQLGPLARGLRAVAADADVAVGVHLDHVESLDLLRQAPEHGFSSVMFDGSTLSYEDNVGATVEAVGFAHRHGLWLEAELGVVGGKDGAPPRSAHAPGSRTDPSAARSFVAATGVDALAVAVGSSHAMTTRTAVLDHDLITELRRSVPVPLVLHGSSGVAEEELRAAIRHGIVKVNVGTALNVAFTSAVRRVLDLETTTTDPRRYLRPARTAMADAVAHFLSTLDPRSTSTGPDNATTHQPDGDASVRA